jgi:hypothetical protein
MNDFYGESDFYADVEAYENWRQYAADGETIELTPAEVAVYDVEDGENDSDDEWEFIF